MEKDEGEIFCSEFDFDFIDMRFKAFPEVKASGSTTALESSTMKDKRERERGGRRIRIARFSKQLGTCLAFQ